MTKAEVKLLAKAMDLTEAELDDQGRPWYRIGGYLVPLEVVKQGTSAVITHLEMRLSG